MPSTHVRFDTSLVDGWSIVGNGKRLEIHEVLAGYFRRPGVPELQSAIRDVGDIAYCEAEWSSILRSIYTAIGRRWLNSPADIAAAEDKPRQLALARSCGLLVPETLITNDYDLAKEFVANGPTVAKPLRESLIEGKEERVIFTNRICSLDMGKAAEVTASPVILQREIAKAYDIRATVIGQRVLSASIYSQEYAETSVDWRRGSRPDLRHEAHILPETVVAACVEVTAALGLRFSAIDLIQDRDGAYWFLEVNPNGQWAWIENRTGLPIASAIVDELQAISTQ